MDFGRDNDIDPQGFSKKVFANAYFWTNSWKQYSVNKVYKIILAEMEEKDLRESIY